MRTNFDQSSEPKDDRPLPSVRGASVIWEDCEKCEGEGHIDGVDDDGRLCSIECPACHGKRGRWVEDMPDFD